MEFPSSIDGTHFHRKKEISSMNMKYTVLKISKPVAVIRRKKWG